MSESPAPPPTTNRFAELKRFWPQLILLAVLAIGAYLRFTGLDWDEGAHLHPDERFLTLVEGSLQPVGGLGEYFDTATSTLNPSNTGHPFFVYGTLPIFIVRYLGEWLDFTGYGEIYLLGRAASAFFDIISILLVYLIGRRLYRERVALLGAAFTALTVLLIQHAHFFVVDPFANTFILAGFYFAVRVLDEGRLTDYVFFGILLGMAVASKISSAPLAATVALAALARYLQVEEPDRPKRRMEGLQGLLAAAALSLVVFRLFQPYAFTGPGFLGIRLNPDWLSVMSEVRAQTSGHVDFPPALQWADRTPVLFSLRNMVLWGFGLPLGLAAWASWGWAVIEILRRRSWDRHLLPVVWAGGYFLWRSSGFTQAMRYQLPVYPILAIVAAWGLWQAWDRSAEVRPQLSRWLRPGIAALGGGVLLLTGLYAFGFLRVYTEPMTRVEASRWIYSHVPSSVNVIFDTEEGDRLEPLAVPQDAVLMEGEPLEIPFGSNFSGRAEVVMTPAARSLGAGIQAGILHLSLHEGSGEGQIIARGVSRIAIPPEGETQFEVQLQPSVEIVAGAQYVLRLELEGPVAVRLEGQPALVVESNGEQRLERLHISQETYSLSTGEQRRNSFTAHHDGTAQGVRLAHLQLLGGLPLEIRATLRSGEDEVLAQARRSLTDPAQLAGPVDLTFETGWPVEEGGSYQLELEVVRGGGLSLRGATIVHESSWDDPLPQRIDGYDIGGRYASRNLEFYWPDNEDKDENGRPDQLERITESLAAGDYFFISSNRQYGTIARVPSRYPLTTAFYRELFACPPPHDVSKCADAAKAGQVDNDIGYELVKVFETNPRVNGLEISDQSAEESFTVYDHPQVMVFAKTEAFSKERIRAALADVDLSEIQNLPPEELTAGRPSTSLMLPEGRWRELRAAGTWSALFPPDNPLNRSQPLAVILWWLTIGVMGWIAWPLVRRVFPGLTVGGYGIARVMGLLLFAWLAWIGGSLGLPVTRTALALLLLGFAAISAGLAYLDRERLLEILRKHRREILLLESLALGFFLLDLVIRFGNPDLWHPAKGGEKPMDLSYLNAVLKSRTFPPFDPWFAGGYINYYYFGFLIVGLPMKLLGIETTLAYNLALPTLFSLLALSAYTGGYHLVAPISSGEGREGFERLAGAGAAIALVLFGNLATLRMIWEAFQEVGAAGEGAANLLGNAIAAFRGFFGVLFRGESLPIALDSWYWNPSRAIPPGPGEPGPITEFPFFTFLYADLHAHLISLPLTMTTLVWGISWLRASASRALRHWGPQLLALLAGGLLIGSLRPTNTWDFPVYLILGSLAVLASGWLRQRRLTWRSVGEGLLAVGLLVGLSYLLYQPYSRWYGQGYTAADLWRGSKTSIDAYLTVYGVFLFVFVSWLLWETREWMAQTPISALARLRPWFPYLAGLALAVAATAVGLAVLGYLTVLLVVPLELWVGLLFLRPRLDVGRRVGLFLVGTGLALTLVVEAVVLRGDIGRMNTVFKFYLQVWTLFSLVIGAAVAWVARDLDRWSPGWRNLWQIVLAGLAFCALLYPVTATPAKISDRMNDEAPKTLDGAAFMRYAERSELGQRFPLEQDYEAIQWLQGHVEGSPVIVEANIPEYRWGSRHTIYTGLPNVLGWNWHQRQQRVAAGSERVTTRASEISSFYMTRSVEEAKAFLDKYDVRYVTVGWLEHIYYGRMEPCLADANGDVTCDLGGRPIGVTDAGVRVEDCEPADSNAEDPMLVCNTHALDKFQQMVSQGDLRVAFESGKTRVYEVVRQ